MDNYWDNFNEELYQSFKIKKTMMKQVEKLRNKAIAEIVNNPLPITQEDREMLLIAYANKELLGAVHELKTAIEHIYSQIEDYGFDEDSILMQSIKNVINKTT